MMARRRAVLALAVMTLAAGAARAAKVVEVVPTVMLRGSGGALTQMLEVRLSEPVAGPWSAEVTAGGTTRVTAGSAAEAADTIVVEAPACAARECSASVALAGGGGPFAFTLPYQRRWTVYLSPFSHIDAGFTNSQRKILAQNLDNLRTALDLVEATRAYPQSARFKFFTEVSWPAAEFLDADTVTDQDQERLLAALRSGDFELGGFLISHQNKFMPAEALFRSPEWALELGDRHGFAVKTACLNDLADASAVVRPLAAAGIPYLVVGPNTMHYVAPPLFYLQPPGGDEKVLVWLTPNLNGYGENFDFAMRPELPIEDDKLAAISGRLAPYLKSLERSGAPPEKVRAHYDFFGAVWPYPYDIYFMPYYPAHAVDNGPQDAAASELARAWNGKWAWPRLVVANPAEFFAEALGRYAEQVPVVRGELPGFWGEQIFFALAQTDPAKEAGQRAFERDVISYEAARVKALFTGRALPDYADEVREGFKLIALNNDHNPGPVPFGNTPYTQDDVAEWKRTRQEWVARIAEIGWKCREAAGSGSETVSPGAAAAEDNGNEIALENEYYRVTIDKTRGGISSLVDKELGRELARSDEFLLNEYVAVARGENAGVRGNLFARRGFRRVRVEVIASGPERAAVRVSGPAARHPDQLKVFSAFTDEAFGFKVPALLLRAVVPALKVKLGPLDEVWQEIELRPGERAVYFTQHLGFSRDQAIDHAFAYPLDLPADRPLIVEGPYAPYRFAPGPPLGTGDLVPAAAMSDPDFPGINALTQVFAWIQKTPADAVFRTYALGRGDGVGVAFSSPDSGAVLPGPLTRDPGSGPFGGGFFHLGLGWTAYGQSFLGAPREGEITLHSALTSFAAQDEAEGRTRAARFANSYLFNDSPLGFISASNPAVMVASARPSGEHEILVRLYETSGTAQTAAIAFPGGIVSAARDRSGTPLPVSGNSFAIALGPGEVVLARVTAAAPGK